MRNSSYLAAIYLLIFTVVLAACSDTDPKSRELQPTDLIGQVDLRIDSAARAVSVSGRLRQLPWLSGSVRLVDGDAFLIDWAGRYYQLYRRSRNFRYEADLPFQFARNVNLRLKLTSSGVPQVIALPVQLPDITSFQLQQTMQSVASNTELNTSWNLDIDELATGPAANNQNIEGIDVLAQPTMCFDASGMRVLADEPQLLASVFSSDTDSQSLTIPAAEILVPVLTQDQSISTCNVDLQLLVNVTYESQQPERAGLQLDVVMESSIVSLIILDAVSNGLSPDTRDSFP